VGSTWCIVPVRLLLQGRHGPPYERCLVASRYAVGRIRPGQRAVERGLVLHRATSQVYQSPSDLPQPQPADVGYLSRLRRPDGNGTFILLTGIHAVGSHGIIDYLRRELADLYEEVDLQPFSTLITTEYDPATRQVVRSERITPLYQHQEP
jgi:hypothetical protein